MMMIRYFVNATPHEQAIVVTGRLWHRKPGKKLQKATKSYKKATKSYTKATKSYNKATTKL